MCGEHPTKLHLINNCTDYSCACYIAPLPLPTPCHSNKTLPKVHVILGVYCYVAYHEVTDDHYGPRPVAQLKKTD